MMRFYNSVLIGVMVMLIAACGTRPPRPDAAAGMSGEGQQFQTEGQGTSFVGTYVGETSKAIEFMANVLKDPANPLSARVIYFDYDSNEIKPEFQPMLDAHGQFLLANPGVRVRIEGHTDERGTHEYNISLGERRGQAVQRVLLLKGLLDDQAEVISYGKEKLVDAANTEEAHSKNRRAVLIYKEY